MSHARLFGKGLDSGTIRTDPALLRIRDVHPPWSWKHQCPMDVGSPKVIIRLKVLIRTWVRRATHARRGNGTASLRVLGCLPLSRFGNVNLYVIQLSYNSMYVHTCYTTSCVEMCVYIYIYHYYYQRIHMYVYVYIYIERERYIDR